MGGVLSSLVRRATVLTVNALLSILQPRAAIGAESQADPVDSEQESDDRHEMDDYPAMSVSDMVRTAKSTSNPVTLAAIVQLASDRDVNLFHYAAAVGDREFLGIAMSFLPVELLVREMRRKNANGLTPLECASDGVENTIKTFFMRKGVALDEHSDDSKSPRLQKLRDVVGMSATCKKLLRLVDTTNRNPRSQMKPLLLHGPPGTGKSFVSACLAAELGRDVVEIKCQDVLTRHLGGTEARILACFQRAARAQIRTKKAVVVVNEFESLCPATVTDSAQGSEGWHSTVRQCLITLLDDTRNSRSEFFGLLVVATTNYLDRVDVAVRDRMTSIHVPLPSEADIKILLPKLCGDHEPNLNVSQVDWSHIASIAHKELSVRGIQDALSAVAQNCKGSSATTQDFESAVYERIGRVQLKPLNRPDRFARQVISHSLLDETNVKLETCLARCGWNFASAPTSVYRQVLTLEQISSHPSGKFILREFDTENRYAGAGCYRKLTTATNPFDKYEVFIQCSEQDGSLPVPINAMACFIESYGNIGVRKLEWRTDDCLELFPPPAVPMTVSAFLAPMLKSFTARSIFIEIKSTTGSLAFIDDLNILLIETGDPKSYVAGASAKLIAGSATPQKLKFLGYQAFMAVSSKMFIVSPQMAILYRVSYTTTGLTRLEVARDRFVRCPNSATTVGDTLRANGIYYAVCDAVFIQQTRFEDLDSIAAYGDRLLAISVTDSPHIVAWKGPAIATFAAEETFRAEFQVFGPCTSSTQSVILGASLLLDKERIPPAVDVRERMLILRYYPAPGTVSQDTRTHHGVCISDSKVQVSDKGYRDDDFLVGFRRGWYENVYWRAVGDGDKRFLSGGVSDNSYKFNIRKEHDFGYDNKRIMIKLPGIGIVFCRGVGSNPGNPEMACVLFDTNGNVRDKYGFMGQLGRWRDIVQ